MLMPTDQDAHLVSACGGRGALSQVSNHLTELLWADLCVQRMHNHVEQVFQALSS
jgi:hypothetical protein